MPDATRTPSDPQVGLQRVVDRDRKAIDAAIARDVERSDHVSKSR